MPADRRDASPRVSVVMATFDGARHVEQQLLSILTQSPPPDEVIVTDDGSSDDTLQIVARLAAAHPGIPVRVVGGPRAGVTANFERGIQATSGNFVVLADQDDVWHVDRLAVAVEALASDPEVLLQHADADLVDAVGAGLRLRLFEALGVDARVREDLRGSRAFEVYLRRNLATGATVTFRRELMAAAAPFPAAWVHDEWLAIIASATGRIQVLDDVVIDYRQHGSNQIGVARPTLSYRMSRLLGPRGDRYVRLAERACALVDRLDYLEVDERLRHLARRKRDFELTRAAYPAGRLRRIGPVLGQLRRGSYSVLSSQGRLDAIRDLLQPAGTL